jgi:hypothetical protein
MGPSRDNLFMDSVLITLLGLGASMLTWGLILAPLIPGSPPMGLWHIAQDHWWHLITEGWGSLQRDINTTWPKLIQRNFPVWLWAATLADAILVGALIAYARRSPWSLVHGVIGWALGGALAACSATIRMRKRDNQGEKKRPQRQR